MRANSLALGSLGGLAAHSPIHMEALRARRGLYQSVRPPLSFKDEMRLDVEEYLRGWDNTINIRG